MKTSEHEIVDYLSRFTDTFKKYSSKDIELRELACLRQQFPFILQPIQKHDLFAGRIEHAPIGFSPQMDSGFGYYLDETALQSLIDSDSLPSSQKKMATDLLHFWKHEQTSAKTRFAYPRQMAELLPSDNWNGESGIAFPLYRLAGSNLNYELLLKIGISGLSDRIAKQQRRMAGDKKAQTLFSSMQLALELLRDICLWYAETADILIVESSDQKEVDRLSLISESLNHIAYFPPETFHQGLQLFWIYALLSGTLNYGRIDVWAVDLYEKGRTENGLTKEEALDMLLSLWQLMSEREKGNWIFDSRVIIGGMGRKKTEWADELALLCIEATRRRHDIMPQLSLRFHKGQNPDLYQMALNCIGENNPYPILYNDDVNVQAVAEAFAVSPKEAVDYLPFGCGEYILDHKSFGTPSGVINLLQALLVTLHNGIDPGTGTKMGIVTGDVKSFVTFDDLYQAYLNQLHQHVQQLAKQEALEYRIAGNTAPFLFFSMLYDDCIERGRSIFDGGIRYLGGTLETYGNSNAADSLLAIKNIVYEQQKLSLTEMVTMLDANFSGFERERNQLLSIPKYGNDDDEADAMLLKLERDLFSMVRQQANEAELHSYLVVVINNNANTIMGRYTAASPDGRPAGTPMNNGNNPSSGMDRNGITAFLNSIVKPPAQLSAGMVQNIKFSKSLFVDHRPLLEQLLHVYWTNGGTQAMITVVGRKDLENAIKNPEKYQNLIVRVGGYSARFVDLEPDIQQEILNRTLY